MAGSGLKTKEIYIRGEFIQNWLGVEFYEQKKTKKKKMTAKP